MASLSTLKPKDRVIRYLGTLPMPTWVIRVTDTRIVCAPFPDVEPREGVWWEVSRRNGAEIDEELGRGETVTGSFIVTNE
jgi:hypothetical protein